MKILLFVILFLNLTFSKTVVTVICIGQSNMVGRQRLDTYSTVSGNGTAQMYKNGAWSPLEDPVDNDFQEWGASCKPNMCTNWIANNTRGLIRVIPCAISGMGITKPVSVFGNRQGPWEDENAWPYVNAKELVEDAGLVGTKVCIFWGGEEDIIDSVPAADIRSGLETIRDNVKSDWGVSNLYVIRPYRQNSYMDGINEGFDSAVANNADIIEIYDASNESANMIDIVHFNKTGQDNIGDTIGKFIDSFGTEVSLTSGEVNCGTGELYLTRAELVADMGNLTGNITVTQTSNITETIAGTFNENLNGYTFEWKGDTSHNGVLTQGRVINENHTGHGFNLDFEGPGQVIIHDIRFLRQQAITVGIANIFTPAVDSGYTAKIYNIISDNDDNGGQFCRVGNNSCDVEIYANLAINGAYGMYINPGLSSGKYINNTFVNNSSYGISTTGGDVGVFVNNAFLGNGVDFDAIGSTDGYNNVSSDTTANGWNSGENNLINVDINTAIDTTTYSIVINGVLDNSGTDPTNYVDILEYINSIPLQTMHDIGAFGSYYVRNLKFRAWAYPYRNDAYWLGAFR